MQTRWSANADGGPARPGSRQAPPQAETITPAFSERMQADPQVRQCHPGAGPWDYVVVLAARSMCKCRRLGDRLFKADDNIRRYETLIAFDTIKTGLALPPPAMKSSGQQDGRR
ncbi:Lrp/AsnC family transcriptional regulator [Spirillospora sp. NPDC052242]